MRTVSKQAAKTLATLITAAEANTAKPGYLKLDNSQGAFMPVTVERVGDETNTELWSVAHYYTQNGDAMRDPEIVYAVPVVNGSRLFNYAYPVEFTQDGMPASWAYQRLVEFEGGKPVRFTPGRQASAATFTTTWMRNIKAQQGLA